MEGGWNVYATINFVADAQSGVMALDFLWNGEMAHGDPGGNGFTRRYMPTVPST